VPIAGVTIGKNEHALTARHDGGVIIKLHHIDFCQVGGYPADRVSGGHIPKKDRSVSARGDKLGIVVCPARARRYGMHEMDSEAGLTPRLRGPRSRAPNRP
jgi:hypothetical protein